MARFKLLLIFFFFFTISLSYGQLGFCVGSKGDAIFTESFGNGTDYGPALAPGITTYNFTNGGPQDGSYTLFYRTNLLQSWHNSPDHTDDATDGPNGKSLIVNANNNTSGEFYKRTVSGLCINTTFEFFRTIVFVEHIILIILLFFYVSFILSLFLVLVKGCFKIKAKNLVKGDIIL